MEANVSTDFVQQIKDAELQAQKIIEQAEKNAKSKLEHNKRELGNKLELARTEYDQKIRFEKSAAEEKSERDLVKSLAELTQPEISDQLREEAADQVLERIVDLLGNS